MIKEVKLIQKLYEMKRYEEELYRQGVTFVAGLDEVGRGPLAGPVVAAAVILPKDFSVLGVDDSKKLSEKKRTELFDAIIENAICYGLGLEDNHVIDQKNILEATKSAMEKAVIQLNQELKKIRNQETEFLLIDALTLKGVEIPQSSIIKGDSKSVSIAAASILAKVTRDRMMIEYHRLYPHYAFHKNKGYGTKEHYEGLDAQGLSPIHRRSFLKKYKY